MSEKDKGTVVVTAATMGRVLDSFRERFLREGWTVKLALPTGQRFTSAELSKVCADARAVIIGDDEVTRDFFLETSPELELMVKWGIGTDSVDIEAAKELGVVFHNTPGVFGDEVADLVLGYVIVLARNIVAVHDGVRDMTWPQPTGESLRGKTIGVIGFGSIGRAVAIRAAAFGMEVLISDPYLSVERSLVGVEEVSREQLFRGSDFVVLACPSTPETQRMITREVLLTMKESAYLVNVSRGDLVVEEDLSQALQEGKIAGAALDVYEQEPLPAQSDLRSLSNIVFGSHNASNTVQGLLRASELATTIILDWGRKPPR